MAWRIPETDIERVKRQTDLLALVQSRGIELKKHGSKDWIGRCPFHQDKDKPNFIVTPGKGLFHCMACGKAGQRHPVRRAARRRFVPPRLRVVEPGRQCGVRRCESHLPPRAVEAIHRAASAVSVGSCGG